MAINIGLEASLDFCPPFTVLCLSGLVLFSPLPLRSVLWDCTEKSSEKEMVDDFYLFKEFKL